MTVSNWPVLAACIEQDRNSEPEEIERLAQRICREMHAGARSSTEDLPGSDQRRLVAAVVRAAVGLGGWQVASGASATGTEGSASTFPAGEQLIVEQPLSEAEPEQFPGGTKSDEDCPLDDEDYAVLAAFRRDLRVFLRFSERAAEDAGITAQQYQVLLALRAAPGRRLSVGALANQMLLAPHSASGLVSRLEAAGLVERLKPQGDGRRVHIRIANKGANVLSSLAQAHRLELRQMGPMLASLVARLGAFGGGVGGSGDEVKLSE